jgi:hypothetical protein
MYVLSPVTVAFFSAIRKYFWTSVNEPDYALCLQWHKIIQRDEPNEWLLEEDDWPQQSQATASAIRPGTGILFARLCEQPK